MSPPSTAADGNERLAFYRENHRSSAKAGRPLALLSLRRSPSVCEQVVNPCDPSADGWLFEKQTPFTCWSKKMLQYRQTLCRIFVLFFILNLRWGLGGTYKKKKA